MEQKTKDVRIQHYQEDIDKISLDKFFSMS